jgi:hypothetical protein
MLSLDKTGLSGRCYRQVSLKEIWLQQTSYSRRPYKKGWLVGNCKMSTFLLQYTGTEQYKNMKREVDTYLSKASPVIKGTLPSAGGKVTV